MILLALTIILLGAAGGLVGALVLPKTYGARAEIFYPINRTRAATLFGRIASSAPSWCC